MANSSILGGTPAAPRPPGRDVDTLGPSDSSDSGSDVRIDAHTTNPDGLEGPGPLPVEHGSDTDAAGTGERGSATGDGPREAADIQPDQVEVDPAVGNDEDLDAVPVSGGHARRCGRR